MEIDKIATFHSPFASRSPFAGLDVQAITPTPSYAVTCYICYVSTKKAALHPCRAASQSYP